MINKDFNKKPLGQILIEAGLISISQIEIALQKQQNNDLRVGEILVLHDWIRQQTVDFFLYRWFELLKEEKKPLAYYFQEAGLLSREQIDTIMRLQKLNQNKDKFHDLVVKEGYLKQMTIDFFSAYLLNNTAEADSLSLGKVYELVEGYARKETDFQGIELCKAPLMSLSLPGIKLDGSNLSKADLSRANLSNSSLAEVDLTMANLTQAVLKAVDFSNSLLKDSNLQESNLEQANFQSAVLQNVDLRGANLAEANFAGANLKSAILPLHYSYNVYFDDRTDFDDDFDPELMNWKKIESK